MQLNPSQHNETQCLSHFNTVCSSVKTYCNRTAVRVADGKHHQSADICCLSYTTDALPWCLSQYTQNHIELYGILYTGFTNQAAVSSTNLDYFETRSDLAILLICIQ